MNKSVAIRYEGYPLTGPFAHGNSYKVTPFKSFQNSESKSEFFEIFNFTQKIENIEDFLLFKSKEFSFQGYSASTSSGISNGLFSADAGVSWFLGYGALQYTQALDNGLENLELTSVSKKVLASDSTSRFLDPYGFHAYDSMTFGQSALCVYSINGNGVKESEIIRDKLKNVTTDIFYSEDAYNELQSIELELGPISSAGWTCEFNGISPFESYLTSFDRGAGVIMDQTLNNFSTEGTPFPIQGTIAPLSNSVDFETEFEKLPAAAAAEFINDARVTFTLQEDIARVLMEDYAKNIYISEAADRFRFGCTTMSDLYLETTIYQIRHELYNATQLRDISNDILEGKYVGEGAKNIDLYAEAIKSCYASANIPSSAPILGPLVNPPASSSSSTFRQITFVFVILVTFTLL